MWLKDLCLLQGHAELDQFMILKCHVVKVIGKGLAGELLGGSHALTTQWGAN